jgi:hypothetical protein
MKKILASLATIFMAVGHFSQTFALTFDDLNPLNPAIGGGTAANQKELSTPGSIIGRAYQYIFPIAGLILFVMIVWGGFEMLSGAASAKAKDAGKQRVTAAIGGFLLLFSTYWIVQIVEAVFGVTILK